MTIYNMRAFLESITDWGIFNGCAKWNPSWRFSDLDGVGERNYHKLYLESKPGDKAINGAQRKVFETFAYDGNSSLILWNRERRPTGKMTTCPCCNGTGRIPELEPNEIAAMQFWPAHEKQPRPKFQATVVLAREIVRRWYDWADRNHKMRLDEREKDWKIGFDPLP